MRDKEPVTMYENLQANYFEEKRHPGVGHFFDTSRRKVGRQSLQNRLMFMRGITYPWNACKMSNDLIRIEMKKAFFPESFFNMVDKCTSPLAVSRL